MISKDNEVENHSAVHRDMSGYTVISDGGTLPQTNMETHIVPF